MRVLICKVCGKEFESIKRESGRLRKYCSAKCKASYDKDHKKKYDKVCAHCGKPFITTYRPGKFCSADCHKKSLKHVQKEVTCPLCGKAFRVLINSNRKYCSQKCGAIANQRYALRHCAECGKETTGMKARRGLTRFCSKECRNKFERENYKPNPAVRRRVDAKRRMGILVALETFKPIDIYERDGWVCQVCGKKVNPKLKHPDVMAATLDHIIPLSKGGDHTRKNVQLAHRSCNSTKGAKDGGQLRLFG